MGTTRRTFLNYSCASIALAAPGISLAAESAPLKIRTNPPYRRIATEEALISEAVRKGFYNFLNGGALD